MHRAVVSLMLDSNGRGPVRQVQVRSKSTNLAGGTEKLGHNTKEPGRVGTNGGADGLFDL
jgi:hypothetical protein